VHYKNQKFSSFDWDNIKINDFLSFKNWKERQLIKDESPEFENILRDRSNKELAAHFFQCVGSCKIERAMSYFTPQFRTNIYEGDEILTVGNSYAWIFFMDGTMVRLAPDSSITVNEINIGKNENFINVRVNMGDVLWLSRQEMHYAENNYRETDVLFKPVALFQANLQHSIKKIDESNLFEIVEEDQSVLNQNIRLNKLIDENNEMTHQKKTFHFIVLPNITVIGSAGNLELITMIGGNSYVKQRSNKSLELNLENLELSEEEIQYQLRGFENKEWNVLLIDKWMMVDQKGTMIMEDPDDRLKTAGEIITKRIPSVMVARELLIKEYSSPFFNKEYDPLKLAQVDGYRLWGNLFSKENKKEDLFLRVEFLKEYFRRIETTNLLMFDQLKSKRNNEDSGQINDYSEYYFEKAINRYYSFEESKEENEDGEVLNSKTKRIWKELHGLQ
jgi:hypothetical protein